jgi:hypothetical protein
VWARLWGHGGSAEVAGERAREGDCDDVAGLASFAQASVLAVEAVLAAPGDLEHVRGLAVLALAKADTDPRRSAALPGGLGEDAAGVAGAGLGDRALRAALARLAERGDEPEPGGKLGWRAEAGEVADLERQHERRQRVESAEAAQPLHARPPVTLERQAGEALVERAAAGN